MRYVMKMESDGLGFSLHIGFITRSFERRSAEVVLGLLAALADCPRGVGIASDAVAKVPTKNT